MVSIPSACDKMTIKPSLKLFWFSVSLYTGAGIAMLVCGLPLVLKVAFLFLLSSSAKLYFNRYIFLNDPRSVVSFWKNSDGFWFLRQSNMHVRSVILQKTSFITRFLTVLHFYTENRERLFVLLTPESIGLQDYRRLIVLLRHS